MVDRDNDNYMDYLDDFSENDTKRKANSQNNTGKSRQISANRDTDYYNRRRKRKGLKWILLDFLHSKAAGVVLIIAVLIIIIAVAVSMCGNKKTAEPQVTEPTTTVAPTTELTSYKISGVPVIVQDDLTAACETYACTMLLQYYQFDIDEYEFVDNYLVTRPVYYGEDGNCYGPDMNSAYAGDIYTGYGINAIGMAKCMNNYIKTTESKLTAYPLSNVPLEDLCEEYILNNTPVMVWATTYMEEPYVQKTWIVDYADDDSPTEIGDTVSWQMHEHCMVLIGFDAKNYYFCDSVSGKVSSYDKATTEERYSQIGTQAIVLK